MPLLAETLILTFLAYLIGIGLGWLLFGRARKTSFLGDG
jgi:ABC-type antimicrobial peptide transport system permease subunit